LSDAHARFGANIPVLVAVHNRGVDMVKLIESIEHSNFKSCFNMFDYAHRFDDDQSFRFFLADPITLIPERDKAEKFFSLLADDISKALYLELLKFRLSGDYRGAPKPVPEYQYSPIDIPRWKSPMRLIDCGAFNGDSIKLFQSYKYDIENVIAFEPDLLNYQQLLKITSEFQGIFLPCGASNTAKSVFFNAGAGEGSRVTRDGSIAIQMLSIDEAFSGTAPTLIKMDIEGGERDAILGARETIKKYKPGLAISAYHLPSDIWQLGLLISEIDSGYRYYMRTHAYSSFETVLYAIPK
jgi:FkbM family methyltransferase